MNNENSLVSVIIPTYKRPKMLGKSLESVFNQTYNNIEIIVVDDNNKDSDYRKETEVFMKKYDEISNLKYIKHNKNKGGSAARNTGIDIAKGFYITFLDDDDQFYPEKVEKQVNKFRSSDLENLGFVYCQIEKYNRHQLKVGSSKNYYKGNKRPFEINMVKTIAGTPTIMVLKSVLTEIKGFTPLKSGQDWFLILKILDKGYQTDFMIEPLVRVYVHSEERMTNNLHKLDSLVERFEIKKKYFHKMSNDSIKIITYKHYLQIANFLKYDNKKKSMKYFLKALKYKKISVDNISYLMTFILGGKIVEIIKRSLV